MIREFICIACPNGCDMEAEIVDKQIISVKGAKCKRGNEYISQEVIDPKRNIASSVKVISGEIPLVSVRLTDLISKDRIFDTMSEIKKIKIEAPVKIGQVLISNVLNLGVDVIATKHINLS